MAKTSGKFIKVYDWMFDLGLTSDEVLALAYIHTLTQKGLEFYGSAKMLADKLGKGRTTTIQMLHALTEKGLLVKVESSRPGMTCRYTTPDNISTLKSSEIEPSRVQKLNAKSSETERSRVQDLRTTCSKTERNNSNYNSKSITVNNTPSNPPAHPTLAEVEEYARQLHAVNPHAFADFFIKFCEANEWKTRNGQGNPITNWRNYILSSWGHRLNDPFKNYSPTPQRPAPSYRHITSLEDFKASIR